MLRSIDAARLYPERKTALLSHLEKCTPVTVAPVVPSRSSAPLRSSAQSPPDGLPRASINVGRVPVTFTFDSVKLATGSTALPRTLKRVAALGATRVGGGDASVPLYQK